MVYNNVALYLEGIICIYDNRKMQQETWGNQWDRVSTLPQRQATTINDYSVSHEK